jgi:hypothetical protein
MKKEEKSEQKEGVGECKNEKERREIEKGKKKKRKFKNERKKNDECRWYIVTCIFDVAKCQEASVINVLYLTEFTAWSRVH